MNFTISRVVTTRVEYGQGWALHDFFLLGPWQQYDRLRRLGANAAKRRGPTEIGDWSELTGATYGSYIAMSHAGRMRQLAALCLAARSQGHLAGIEGPFLTLLHGADLAGDGYWSVEGRAVWAELAGAAAGREASPFVMFLNLGTGELRPIDHDAMAKFDPGKALPFGTGRGETLRPGAGSRSLFGGGVGALVGPSGPFRPGGVFDPGALAHWGPQGGGEVTWGSGLGSLGAPRAGITPNDGAAGIPGMGGALGSLVGIGAGGLGGFGEHDGFGPPGRPVGGPAGIGGKLGNLGNAMDGVDPCKRGWTTGGAIVGGVVGGYLGAWAGQKTGALTGATGGKGFGGPLGAAIGGTVGGFGGMITGGLSGMGAGAGVGKMAGDLASDWMCPTAPAASPQQSGGDIDGVELNAGTAFFNNGATPINVTTHMPDGSTTNTTVQPGDTLLTPAPPADPPPPEEGKEDPPEDNPNPDEKPNPDDGGGKPNPDDMPNPEDGGGGGPRSAPWLRDVRPSDDDTGGGSPHASILREGAMAFSAMCPTLLLNVITEQREGAVTASLRR